jgi:hypothetical protein
VNCTSRTATGYGPAKSRSICGVALSAMKNETKVIIVKLTVLTRGA